MEAVSGLIVLFDIAMILPLIIALIMLLLSSLLLSACPTARPHGRAVFSCRGMRGENSGCPEDMDRGVSFATGLAQVEDFI